MNGIRHYGENCHLSTLVITCKTQTEDEKSIDGKTVLWFEVQSSTVEVQ
jgi:hypothetical protein